MSKKRFWEYLLIPYYCIQLAVITCKLHFSKPRHTEDTEDTEHEDYDAEEDDEKQY